MCSQVSDDEFEVFRKQPEAHLDAMREKGMYIIGGLHTNSALVHLQTEAAAGRIPKEQVESFWYRYPCKLYLFPGDVDDHTEVLQVLGAEDNAEYLLKTPFHDRYRTCMEIFLREFADPKTKTWKVGSPTKEEQKRFVNRILVHCLPRVRRAAVDLAGLVARPPNIQALIWRLITGDYKLPPKSK